MTDSNAYKMLSDYVAKNYVKSKINSVLKTNKNYVAYVVDSNGNLDEDVLFLNPTTNEITTKDVLTFWIDEESNSATEIFKDDPGSSK